MNNVLLDEKDLKREKRIISKLKLQNLPFIISPSDFCERYLEIFQDLKPLFKYKEGEYAMKWCLSTEKKMKVFLMIFEANESGKEIYKESISSELKEYSYKTVASIIDEGIDKGYFVNLKSSDVDKIEDKKIHNIRPSEELTVDFINWNIDAICILRDFCDLTKKN